MTPRKKQNQTQNSEEPRKHVNRKDLIMEIVKKKTS